MPSPEFKIGERDFSVIIEVRCQRRYITIKLIPPHTIVSKFYMSIAISITISGSGIVGTVAEFTGLRPAAAYCSRVSSTTAPLTGVTS